MKLVSTMVTISTRVKRFGQVLAIAEEFDDVFCSVGTHPHNAAEELDVTGDLALPGLDDEHPLGLLPEAVLGELATKGRLRHDPEREVRPTASNVRVCVVQRVQVHLPDLTQSHGPTG